MFAGPAVFSGTLIHRRYQPMRHSLSYKVSDVLLDVDQLREMNTTSWLFGYNRNRLFSIHDKNHGPGDGTAIAKHVRGLMQGLDLEEPIARIFMLCYPAVLGRVFNPVTVYFGLAKDGRWLAVVYEVNNTFGQRHSYVLPVGDGTGHKSEKCFYVSPFNDVAGEYHFSVERQPRHLRLNIALFEHGKLKMTARFEGNEVDLTDTALLHGLLRLALQPMKVWAAIHWQALRLFLKGLRPTARPSHPRFAASYKKSPRPAPPELQQWDAS
jgi:uncharacterized protein